MLILNYAHPLTGDHIAQIEALTGEPVANVREIPTQLDLHQSLAEQAVALADAAQLSEDAWQTAPLLVVLPSFNIAAAGLLAELHGRMGHFPPVVCLRPVEGTLVPKYEVAEIVNLQAIRLQARMRR